MEVELGAVAGGGGRVTKSNESDDEGPTVKPAIDDTTDMHAAGTPGCRQIKLGEDITSLGRSGPGGK